MIQEEPKYRPIEEGKPNLPFAMIKENLAVPIPQEVIRTRPQGNMKIEYVNVTDLKDLLDIRAGIWTQQIIGVEQIGNQFTCIVRIKIYAADGIFENDGSGVDDVDISSYGDSFSNAFAQAFRRACEAFGLGREMWRKDEIHRSTQPQTQRQNTQNVQQPSLPNQNTQSSAPPPQSNSNASTVSGVPATQKQLNYIASLCVEKGLDEEKLAMDRFNTKFSDLNKTMASDLIKYVSEYKK